MHDPLAGVDAEVVRRARAVRLLLLDVDGVLTDGGLRYDDGGGEAQLGEERVVGAALVGHALE